MQQPPPPHMSPKPVAPYLPPVLPPLSQHSLGGKMHQGIPGLPVPLGGASSLPARPNGLHYPPGLGPPGMSKGMLPTPPPLVSLPQNSPAASTHLSTTGNPRSYPTPPSSSSPSNKKEQKASSPPSSASSTNSASSTSASSVKTGQRRPRSPAADGEDAVRSPKRPRSKSPTGREEDSLGESEDEDTVGDAEATVVDEELFRTSSGSIFIKHLNRGANSCSRCDLHYKAPDHPREVPKEVAKKKDLSTSMDLGKSGSGSSRFEESRHKEDRRDGVKSDSPHGSSSKSADVTRPNSLPQASPYPLGHPLYGNLPYSFGGSDLTPALRQLSEYARPHVIGDRSYGGHPSMDPYMRLASAYPPGSRERLELELEREKRERDAREREMRERELKEMEMREKMKADMDIKPPGFDRLLPPGANPMDPYWTELLKRYAAIPSSASASGLPPGLAQSMANPLQHLAPHMPGIYPPTSLSNDLLMRERERMGDAARAASSSSSDPMRNASLFYEYYQRISYEQIFLHTRAQAAAAAAAKDPAAAAADQARMAEYARLAQHFARADPLSGGVPAPPPGAPSSQTPPQMAGHPMLEAARQQEAMYRELLNRPPYNSDPILQSQIFTQIMAQQEALHRHLLAERMAAADRDRMGGGGAPPSHMNR